VVWCYLNRTETEGVNVAYYTSYLGNLNEIISDLQVVNHSSKLMTIINLLGQNGLMLTLISIPVVCLGLDYNQATYFGFAFLFIAAGFRRQTLRGFRLLPIYIVLYLAVHLVWTPGVAYDRFLIALLPFLLLFLLTELEMLVSLIGRELKTRQHILKKSGALFIGLGITVVVSITLYTYGSELYLSLASASFNKRAKPVQEDQQAIQWINERTELSDTVVCYRDPSLYLSTGRKATRSFQMTYGINWRDHQTSIFSIADENKGRYLLYTSSDFENEYQPDLQRGAFKQLIDQHTEKFIRVFESADGHSTIYRIQNNP
jgi:hypothetical protein